MGYMHINNLYKDQRILQFKECYALEKVHGTSANVRWSNGHVTFHNGGAKREAYLAIFDEGDLEDRFGAIGHKEVVVYGEAYGGSILKQSHRYGQQMRFVAFEVKVGDTWLNVPSAADFVSKLGLNFVSYKRVPTDLEALDAERDAPSDVAREAGMGEQPREGVVLRPVEEVTLNNGQRVMAKHKRDEERETKTPRPVVDPSALRKIQEARAIAEEWVTPMRLLHVLDKIPNADMTKMRDVIAAMQEDVLREAEGEIEDSKGARQEIAKQTAQLFKAHLKEQSDD